MAFLKKISTSFTDAELVQQYKQNNNIDTLGDLYSRYMDLVYGVCLKYLKVPDEAQDAVIIIFEELILKVKKYDIQSFKPWLYQVATNHCLMKIRSTKSNPKSTNEDIMHLVENTHLEDVLAKEINLTLMEHCIEKLPTEQKLVVQLFYLKEQCYKQIAQDIQLDVQKVRSYIQNGRRNLKICMEKTA